MLKQHAFLPDEYCHECGQRRDDPVHCTAPEEYDYELAEKYGDKPGFWGAVVFFVLTFSVGAATVYNICIVRWANATFFLIVTLELLRLWGRYESRHE